MGASQRRVVGVILSVPVGDCTVCYALTLPEADFAFFGPAAFQDLSTPRLFSHEVLFRIAVHKSAWSSGRWSRVAKVEVPARLLEPPPKFMQDPLDPTKFNLYMGGHIRPATRAECSGLECAAVWETRHVEDRLRDCLAGVPNVWLEQLQPK